MPISKYNKYYGGHASKALKAMRKEYGSKEGTSVFYAKINKMKKKGKK